MRACGSSLTCTIFARLKKDPSSGQPCLILVGRCLIFSLLIYHSTKHHLDSTIFSETTRYTNNHSRKNLFRLFQKLPYRKATPGRKATLKKHSVNLIMKVTEICAPKLPHRQWDPILLSPGRTGFSGIQTPITSANWIEVMENPWSSSGRSFQDSRRRVVQWDSEKWWANCNVIQRTSKTRSSSCQCLTKLYGMREDVGEYAWRCPRGDWSFLGPGSKKKWCGTYECKPDGSWNRTAEKMLVNFKRLRSPNFPLYQCLGERTNKNQRRRKDNNTIHSKWWQSSAALLKWPSLSISSVFAEQ